MDWSGCVLVERNPLKVSGAPIVRGTRVQADAIADQCRRAHVARFYKIRFKPNRPILHQFNTRRLLVENVCHEGKMIEGKRV